MRISVLKADLKGNANSNKHQLFFPKEKDI